MDTALLSPRSGSSSRPLRSACRQCGGAVTVDSPHLRITRGGIETYCSRDCLHDAAKGHAPAPDVASAGDADPRGLRHPRRVTIFVVGLGLAALSPCKTLSKAVPIREESKSTTANDQELAGKRLIESSAPYGPFEPTEEEVADDFANALGSDGWLHPLQGPSRRMPIRTTRAFGADRSGDRPYECRSGHCGVDIGGEQWGERVLAASDGIVERANRDPRRSGGKYVRISHRDGTVFTQYFHLAAIPKHIRKGQTVRAGEVVGLLGETGVENSGPHLHFTISVKPSPDSPEVYVDPEPLIALWPLRQLNSAAIARSVPPGIPIGASGQLRGKRRAKRRALREATKLGDGPPLATQVEVANDQVGPAPSAARPAPPI